MCHTRHKHKKNCTHWNWRLFENMNNKAHTNCVSWKRFHQFRRIFLPFCMTIFTVFYSLTSISVLYGKIVLISFNIGFWCVFYSLLKIRSQPNLFNFTDKHRDLKWLFVPFGFCIGISQILYFLSIAAQIIFLFGPFLRICCLESDELNLSLAFYPSPSITESFFDNLRRFQSADFRARCYHIVGILIHESQHWTAANNNKLFNKIKQ